MLFIAHGQKLEAFPAVDTTSNPLDVIVWFSDQSLLSQLAQAPQRTLISNSAGAVEVCAGPDVGFVRCVFSISVLNNDSASSTFHLRYSSGGDVKTATLAAGDHLEYTNNGWRVSDSNGSQKTGSVQDLSGYLTIIAAAAGYQPLDSDLTAVAALAPADNDLLQRKSGVWTNRTPAQFKTDLVLVKADVGLGSVDDTADANKPVSTAQAAADASVLSTAEAYADSLVTAILDDRGSFDASGNVFPSTGGRGAAGAILKGDLWTISVAGTLGSQAVDIGDVVRALANSPGQTAGNWAITEHNFGYVAENSANKDASGGYAGLTLFKLNLVNALGTITSFFSTAATVARTWTMPDKSGTVAMTSDITGTNSGTNTGDETGARVATLLHAATAKTVLVDGDEVSGTDSASSFSLIRTVWSDVRTYLASKAWTWLAAHIFSDQQVSRAMLIDCGATFLDKGNSGTSTQTLDYTAGSHQKITSTGNFTIATSNWPPTGNLGAILLEAVNFGAFTETWPTINWVKPDGTTTTSISTWLAASTGRTAFQTSGTDFVKLWSRDAGTTIYGGWAA